MSILITGGAGYIGSHTCIELAKAGYDFVIIDNLTNSKFEAVKRIETIIGKPVKFYQADVRDKDTLRKIFNENKIEATIHFAGLKAVGESAKIPLEYYKNNLDSTFSLCDVMEEFGVKKPLDIQTEEVELVESTPVQ